MGDKAALIGWRWDDAGEGGAGAPGSARAFNSARTPARLVHEGISTSNLRKYFGKKAREKNRSINQDVASNQFWGVLSRCAPHDGFECNFDSTCFENM